MEEKQFVIRRGIRDNSPRQLILNEKFLSFESKIKNEPIVFSKDEIAEYSFGINFMRYDIAFGREYVISIRNDKKQTLKINFKTYFGRKKKVYNQLYTQIISELWNFYFDDVVTNYLEKYEAEEEFKIGEVEFDSQGITISTNSSIKQKSAKIPWEKIRTTDYATYFAIYSIDDAMNINRGYNYLSDWNTPVLYSVVRTILKRKNIENKG